MDLMLRLLERSLDTLSAQSVHWFDAPAINPLYKQDDQSFSLSFQANNHARPELDTFSLAGLNVLFYPKAKDRLQWWLQTLTQHYSPEQHHLWVVGHNKGGIRSLPSRVTPYFNCHKRDSAKHCSLYELEFKTQRPDQEHWQKFSINNQNIYSLPGVFSHGKLDKGSELLLANLPSLKGHLFEFGVGCGVISTTIAKEHPITQITSVDNDLLAVVSAQKTFAANQLGDISQVIWNNDCSFLEKKPQFNAIVTNPPFHQHLKTSTSVSESFFAQAHQWLKPGGHLCWVANQFLNYEQYVQTHFHSIDIKIQQQGFKVVHAIRK